MNSENNASANDEIRSFFVIGTDEAGYGPNLGPLLVGASCWFLRTPLELGAVGDWRRAFEFDLSQFVENKEVKKIRRTPRSKKKRSASEGGASLFDALDDAASDDESLIPRTFEKMAQVVNCQQAALDDVVSASIRGVVDRLNGSLAELRSRRGPFPLVDSKVLYGASKSLAALERSFWLATLAAKGADSVEKRRAIFEAASFRTALQLVANERIANCDDNVRKVANERAANVSPPWEKDVDFPLPVDAKTGGFNALEETLNRVFATFAENETALVDVAARRVQPLEFNALLAALGLKSELIADVTLSLVVEMILRAASCERFSSSRTAPIFIVLCDKLGGRDRYSSLLSARFPNASIRTVVESRASSVYRFRTRRGVVRDNSTIEFPTELFVEIRFTAKGESDVPTALASICAKYFRELSTIPFNDFWRRATADETLRPTAGYPLDAKRFRAEVEQTRRALEISDKEFWREK